MTSNDRPTVLIAGAGIGGLTAALTLHARAMRPTVVDSAQELRELGVGINLLPHAVRELHRLGLGDDLAKIDVPTLVIHGDSDAIVPFEVSGKRTAEAVKDSRTVVVEGGPHGFNATHAQEFNRALLEFLG